MKSARGLNHGCLNVPTTLNIIIYVMPDIAVQIKSLQELIKTSNKIVFFSGAGISTESGIRDYRSKGGLWDRFQPVTIQEFLNSEEKRKQYWLQKRDLFDALGSAAPNAGHAAIVRLIEAGKLFGVITQNIDGLHQLAGVPSHLMCELHGTNRETICLSCRDLTDWKSTYARLQAGEEAPLCRKCGGYLKPNTISFGQSLKAEVLNQSLAWASGCDLMIAAGSTLVVEPAASIPRVAKQKGAKLVIITLSETPLDTLADLKVEAQIGEVLSQAVFE